jgi:hypothetical protein
MAASIGERLKSSVPYTNPGRTAGVPGIADPPAYFGFA